jgi:hypothetical protein
MTGANAPRKWAVKLLGQPGTSANQDDQTVSNLRFGVGGIGILLALALLAVNWMSGDKVIVPASMSGSYYSSSRNLFVGSLCALGVFLIGYRDTERQDRCTWFAGVCALIVAFAPTAPTPPKTEPTWVNYLHHSAAGALIFTLGLFCWVVFADVAQPQARSRSRAGRALAWVLSAWAALKHDARNGLYLTAGLVVFVSGGLGVYTGIWPTSWSTGWSSLYFFEAVAVFAFGIAWITAGWDLRATTKKAVAEQLSADEPAPQSAAHQPAA